MCTSLGRRVRRALSLSGLFLAPLLVIACRDVYAVASEGNISYAAEKVDPLSSYAMTGDVNPVHDPSILRQGDTYYLFSSDAPWNPADDYLPIRCSKDQVHWALCGRVFERIPAWVAAAVPGVNDLWAPDISYFNGLYHLYYAGSTLNSQQSVIGLATNTTLDPNDPAYRWVDQGEVLGSRRGDDFNAIDPNILVDDNDNVWMTYGSYWSGIKQIQIQPVTGRPITPSVRYDLATRPDVANNPIEGASLIRHGNFYYLFVSIDYCCFDNVSTDNYKQAVGRSTSPHGPFVDMNGTPMLSGGATVLLSANNAWNAPGGGTVYTDSSGQTVIVFHALNMPGGAPYLWLEQVSWVDDWPVLRAAQ